jgi:hypothetical protein
MLFSYLFIYLCCWMEEAEEEEEAGSGVKKSPREYIDVVLVGGGHANVQVQEESFL